MKHFNKYLFSKALLLVLLMLALNSGIANATSVPLNIQSPAYLDTALTTNLNHDQAFTDDLVTINAYADKAKIQAQLDAGINRNGAGLVALDAALFYGAANVPIPNQGVIILGSRLDFYVTTLSDPRLNTPPILGKAPGYANIFVTIALHPIYGPVVVELITYANYPDAISAAFGIPGTPVHLGFKQFNVTVNHDVSSGKKTFAVLSKGANNFIFNYALKVPNIVNGAAKEAPFLDARNDPASLILGFSPTSQSAEVDRHDIILSTKSFPMPYNNGVIKLNGILGGSVKHNQEVATCQFPLFCP